MSVEEAFYQAALQGVQAALEIRPIDKQRLLKLPEAADYLGVQMHVLQGMISAGELPVVARGRWQRIDVRDCETIRARQAKRGNGSRP